MLDSLAKNWWLVLLRGLAGITFGVLAFAWPGLTLLVLVTLWGAYALADGVCALGAAIGGRGGVVPRWWLVVAGLLGIGAGLVAFFSPGMTALALITLIGAWAVVRGIVEIVGAVQLRKEIDNEWWLVASGALSVLFGLMVLAAPGEGALALLWVIGAYAVVFGVMLVGLSLRLRRHRVAAA
jgi:uncharacterized membrane protein HdeD (DUF308 family)